MAGYPSWRLTLAAAIAVALPVASSAQDPGGEAAFLEWARGALHPLDTLDMDEPLSDLAAMDAMIGEARIVAISEAVHSGAEPLEFRNRLFRYLVEEKGFTAIAIESGVVESRVVHDYVLGGEGELAEVLPQGIGLGFDHYPQNHALVRWMREYNSDPAHTAKLRFFGFDISGTPVNRFAARGVDTALLEALDYLERVDASRAALLRERIEPVLPSLFFDLAGAMCVEIGGPWCLEVPEAEQAGLRGRGQYFDLTSAQRDLLTATINDVIAAIERNELVYVAASSPEDYARGLRAAIGARQTDSFLRARTPVGWSPAAGRPPQDDGGQEGRYRAMTDNFAWVLEQIGEDEKILVFASRFHITGAPLTVGDGPAELPFGAELRRNHGRDLVAILNLVGSGEVGCDDELVLPIPPPPPDSMDGLAASLNAGPFLLDMRTAPADAAAWLAEPREMAAGGVQTAQLSRAFDILFFSGDVTPACAPSEDAPRIPTP